MASIGDRVYDNGLGVLQTEGEELVICSAEPTTYAEANTTYRLGNDNGNLSIAAPSDRAGGGRKCTVSAISGGSVTADGTASHIAIIDITNTRLLVTGALSSSQGVTNGNSFNLTTFDIGIPDPA